ncbi:BZ3500_MvSof-1268-A1-R1_Chr1-3g02465 [Microbotryum saponariae]|uniref:BZ3500_MvSof-1268-A1-R1_Chr1-3g02465 protein n=1 Tax=Microbotryum saponariae TaxID=289078 RepID=A0A2X0KCE5_9BASI|nr:BZ3500_MvSof-1268-A1-R1_Chr1-3g02465 [Microbotryum saponariae]SCZ96306.1 BZ3501_MvSof-1269-A2-R1_Chr1-3g02068 [Microbotryum saponariae]
MSLTSLLIGFTRHSRSRLCTPLDHGGFGLIDLPRRLAIDHAKWVFQLRAPDGCFTRHLFDSRILWYSKAVDQR